MSLIQSFRYVISRPNRAALPFIGAGLATALIGRATPWRLTRALGTAGLLFTGFCLYFFRDPKRFTPEDDQVVLAAADGRVTSIDLVSPPEDLGMSAEPVWRVCTFLSVLDVHINRIPVSGTVTALAYHAGTFVNASLDKASEENERNGLCITMADGRQVAVVQIAGLIARRIICDVVPGEQVTAGERFGLIRFGSRTDVYLPPGVKPIVSKGQTMVGGETVLARL
ncbi:phosphatidylserine decarboxylase [Oecophyllibacter saccharovorans]|uniref:phosphatidylserine decarboxylase n=1 Tax=Oecophyllibacter saccharovorans TaxID=2558360 RepID=UPI00114493F3|nr:phosphatidylserine decarboxylase [Oecophyllibacter saccharovorans]QDH14744.1 phosphatidylserine decarboxylase [Oecophyllibacter saccharovorans]TPW34943.1 phosphatidylserine decarboxylase [Oecophyllibacter saccharovorans]